MTRFTLFSLAFALLGWLLFTEMYEPKERTLLLSRMRVALFSDAAGFEAPPPRYGEPLTVQLAEDPMEAYAADRTPTDEDRHFEPLVRGVGGVYDLSLAHAARELAGFYAEHQQLAPSGALAFILDAAGVVGWGVRQAVVVTNAGGDAILLESLEGQLKGREARVGVGEAMLEDRRVIVSLFVGEGVTLAPTPRAIEVDEPWRLEGVLKAGFHSPHLLISDPEGRIEERDMRLHEGGAFSYEEALSAGVWIFELLAEGPHGPTPLTQLTVYAGGELPYQYEDAWPRDERDLEGDGAAADLVFDYINEDRARWGLAPLTRDFDLDDIAVAHSEDMRDNRFVGHRSPRTGLLKDRLSGYRSIAAGENVALNRSLWDAQAGLMRSLGHRRNLLSREFTHVGVGVARRDESYYLTQVFATPPPVIEDAKAARAEILGRINARRRRPLRIHNQLQRAAQRAARRHERDPQRIADQLGLEPLHGVRGEIEVLLWHVDALEQLQVSEGILSSRFALAGLGVHQDPALEKESVTLVLLLAE